MLFEDLGAIWEGFGKVFGGFLEGHWRTLEYVFGLHRHAQNACGPLPGDVKIPQFFEFCPDLRFGPHFLMIFVNFEVILESCFDKFAIILDHVF